MIRPCLVLAALVAALAVFVGCSSLDDVFVFQPNKAIDTQPLPNDAKVEEVILRLPNGTPIHARWFPAQSSPDAIVFCHGNAGNLSDRTRTVMQVRESTGESVLVFDYPGYGRSGGVPDEPGLYAAADAAYDWLTQKQGIEPRRVTLMGESLGAGVAVDLATRRPHRALVLLKPFTSIPELAHEKVVWFPAKSLMASRFDNISKIARCTHPVLIVHGTTDHVIPLTHGERLFAAAREPKQFLPLPNVDHNDPLPPEFYAELRNFLVRADTQRPASLGAPRAN
jgi:fermentation-respiration switch protein FrsA (DUF1100 family)